MADDKDKALDIALGQIEKQFGKGSIMRLGENLHMNVEKIPTGSLALDMALGIGGLPRGRIVEIYGPEASGKSTLAMHVVAEAQRLRRPGEHVAAATIGGELVIASAGIRPARGDARRQRRGQRVAHPVGHQCRT